MDSNVFGISHDIKVALPDKESGQLFFPIWHAIFSVISPKSPRLICRCMFVSQIATSGPHGL
jgi:hypothetical protein